MQRHQAKKSSGDDVGGGLGGSMYRSNTSNSVVGDIYDVVVGFGGSGGDTAGNNAFTTSTFSSEEEMTPSVNVGVPFTATQWQELERQTRVYKYLMASIPVPPELLLPLPTTSFTPTHPNSTSPTQSNMAVAGSLELGISSYGNSNQDPEPWRCKRTDGKKWRCSRDVAPDQKYCERHCHKSRPRSRKPVELHSKISNPSTNNYNSYLANTNLSMFPGGLATTTATSLDQPRSLGWFLKGETATVASNCNQEWQHFKEDITTKVNDQVQVHNSQQSYDQCSLFSRPKSTSSSQETRHFIDAWSLALGGEDNSSGLSSNCASAASSSEKLLPVSSLKLTMFGGGSEENENTHVGSFGIMGLETGSVGSGSGDIGGLRPQWLSTNMDSWMSSPPGGPLAEALCLGISSSGRGASNPASPRSGGPGIGFVNKI